MFVKGLNSKPAGKDAKPAVVEKFNGKKSRDGVNILILGTDGRIGEKSDETGQTPSWWSMSITKKARSRWSASCGIHWSISMVSASKIFLNMMATTTRSSIRPSLSGSKITTKGLNWCVRCSKTTFDIDIQYYAMVDFKTFDDSDRYLFSQMGSR